MGLLNSIGKPVRRKDPTRSEDYRNYNCPEMSTWVCLIWINCNLNMIHSVLKGMNTDRHHRLRRETDRRPDVKKYRKETTCQLVERLTENKEKGRTEQ
jgi:hypothetical protein